MIFKTFDNNIDKWKAKIGILGKSINDFEEAANKRKIDIDDLTYTKGVDKKEAKSQVGSFWNYLSRPKEEGEQYYKNSLGEIITSGTIDSFLPKLDDNQANDKIKEILNWQDKIVNDQSNSTTWQDYYATLGEGEGYVIDLIQNTKDLSKLNGKDLVDANNQARESIKAQNEAMKKQTLGAKAGKFALNALATAGNMLFDMLVSVGINAAIEAWDNYANAQENAIERGNEAFDRMQQNQSKIANAQSVFDSIKSNTVISDNGREITRFEQLSQGVNALNENVSLTKAEFEEYNSILNQLSGAGLTATTSMSNLENQIRSLRQSANYDTLDGLGDWVDGFNAKNNQFATDFTKEIGYQQKINAIDEVFRTGNLERTNIDEVAAKDAEMTYALMSGATSEETNRIINEAEVLKNEQLQLETNSEALKEIAKEFNIDIFDEDGEFSEEKFQLPETQKKLKDAQEMLVSQVESMVRQSAGYLQARFENNPHFNELSETTANMVSGIFNNIDYDTVSASMLDANGNLSKDKMVSWVDGLADNLANVDIQEQFDELFTLNSKKDKMTYSEYKRQSERLIEFISGKVPQLSESLLRKSSGLDDVVEDLEASYNRIVKKFGVRNADRLNTSDLKIAAEIIADDGFSGTFDDLLVKIYTANQAFKDLNSNAHFDAISAADQTENAGDDYLKGIRYLEEAKEMYDKGLIGTDDFKARAAYFSPTGSDDSVNFADNYERAKRYLTEDESGLTNFLNDLQAKGYATSEALADGTNSWSYNIDDLERCAQDMGMSFEWLMDMFGRLEDYDFHNNFVASVEDGSERIADLSKELVEAEAKLAELEADPQSGQTAIDRQREKVNQLRSDILQTQDAMGLVAARSAEDYKKQIDLAKASINTLKEERERILNDRTYGDDTERVASLMEDQIREWASENNIELDAKLNIVNEDSIQGEVYNAVYAGLDEAQHEAEEANEKLVELGKTGTTFDFDTTDAEELENQITEASKLLEEFKNEDGTVNIDLEGAEEAELILETLVRMRDELAGNQVAMSIDTSQIEGELGHGLSLIQSFQEQLNNYQKAALENGNTEIAQIKMQNVAEALNKLPNDVRVALGLDDEGFQAAIDNVMATKIDVEAGVELDRASLQIISDTIAGITPEQLVAAGVDPTLVEGYTNEDKVDDEGNLVVWDNDTTKVDEYIQKHKWAFGTVIWNNLTGAIDAFIETVKNVTGHVTWTSSGAVSATGSAGSLVQQALDKARQVTTGSNADGTFHAHANGTDIAIRHSEEAIVNELGEEGLIRNGVFTKILGGMRKMQLRVGDIILNHKQVRELERNGYVTSNGGRGKLIGAYGGGAGGGSLPGGSSSGGGSGSNAYSGPNPNSNYHSGSNPSSNSYSSSNSNPSSNPGTSSSGDAEKTLKTYDWVENKIKSIERAIDRLDQAVERTYRNWAERNGALYKEMEAINGEIQTQAQAGQEYMRKADESGLSDYYKALVRDGGLSIEDIQDEALQEQIADYQEWYEKARDCEDAIEDLKDDLADLAKTNFDNVSQEFEDQLDVIEHTMDMIDGYIDQTEERGYLAATAYYDSLMKLEKDNVSMLQKEYDALTDALAGAVASGNLEKYSEDWYDMYASILDVDEALQDATTSLYEYRNAMRELEWGYFETAQTYISRLAEESDWLIGLLEKQGKLMDDNGNFTDAGTATKGLHAINYGTYMSQADDYAKEIQKINAELAKDPYNTTLIEKRDDLLKSQRECIDAAYDEIDAVKDLISDAYDKQLDALQQVIDKRKDALDAEKDLYDYQKTIAEKTEKVSSLEKQMNAYAGDDSEEARSTVQQLKVDLEKAKSDLEETEYDKWLSDQERLMDDLYNEYETLLNQRLDDINFVMSEMIDSANNNAGTIVDTLNTATTSVGTTLSDNMNTVWTSSNGIVTKYGENFTTGLSGIATTLETIKNLVNSMVSASQQKAAQQAAEQTARQQAAANKAPASNPLPSATVPPQNMQANNNNGTDTSFFVPKKDFYPKNKLNVDVSIVDRLKYHDFDSSFSQCAMYYAKMGFGGRYTGSAEQNTRMVQWMKSHGLHRGGEIGDLIKGTNDTGFALVKTGETVLTEQATRNLKDTLLLANPFVESIRKMNEKFKNTPMAGMGDTQNVGNVTLDIDNITLPNVKNYDEFKTALLSDSHFEKVMGQALTDRVMGGNSMNKFRYI